VDFTVRKIFRDKTRASHNDKGVNWGCDSVVEDLPSIHEGRSSAPLSPKKEEGKSLWISWALKR
jgi:hypothetical protein